MLRRLIPDPLIVALLAVVGLAALFPAGGAAGEVVHYLVTVAIVLLFFLHGAKLSREAVLAGIAHYRLHLGVLLTTYLMFPLLILTLKWLFPDLLSPQLWTGMLFMAALPSTVQSSIAFTSIARGNVPGAVASASASQIAGVFLTPLLVALLIRAGGDGAGASPASGIGQILLLVLLPFILGHLARPWLLGLLTQHKSLVSIVDRGAILLAVYSAFSDAMLNGIWSRLPVRDLLTLVAVSMVILVFALLFTHGLGRVMGFGRADRITLLFCGTKKSLLQGVPMGRVLFPGPDLGLILLPIMIFHQLQLMACAAIASRLAKTES
ncbi:MAG: bile acid:sodium symporter family protein [Sphingomonadaceae bacterium]